MKSLKATIYEKRYGIEKDVHVNVRFRIHEIHEAMRGHEIHRAIRQVRMWNRAI